MHQLANLRPVRPNGHSEETAEPPENLSPFGSLQMYTTAEAAAAWRIDDQVVRRWARDGRIEAVKFGADWRISYTELARVCRFGPKNLIKRK